MISAPKSALSAIKLALAVGLVGVSLLLDGCGTSAPRELATSSDQTDVQKRARIRLQLAMGYYEQRQMNVALDEIKKALAADPNFSDAFNVRALIYMDMGETKLAEENFQQALRLSPNNPDLANNYGWFLCQSGHVRQSIAYFEQALGNRSYLSPAKAQNNAGVCSLKMGDGAAAERYLMQAFQNEPGNPVTSLNLAQVYYERHDYERARFYIGRAIKAELNTAEAYWLAVKIEHKLGDRLTEASMAAQLRRRHPNSPEYTAYQRGAFDER
jgi:type IV pilus assembly protein PilF